MKITVLCSRNAWECHAEVHAARWVQAFKGGRVTTTDTHHSGCLPGDVDGVCHLPQHQQCTINNL